jgi:type I restriction enzyme S subunit
MKMIELGDVADLIMGQSPPGDTYNTLGYGWPFFQGKTEFGKVSPTPVKWCTQPKKMAQSGDILISVRAPVGPTNLANQECCIGRGLAAIRAKSVNRNFLWLYLRYSENTLAAKGQGSTFEAINGDDLKTMEIPDFPIEKQRQIAARLKGQLAELDKARQAAAAQLRETAKLADAIVFDSIRHGKSTKSALDEVLVEVKEGIGNNWADYPVLGATRDGLAPAKEPPGKKPERYKPVFPRTVFYNPMRILIGSIALVDDDDTPGITSPDYVALQGKEGLVDTRWFYYWLRSPLGEQCILSLARGAVRERMLFNRLAEGEIELPDFTTQQKASAALASLKPMRRAIESKINDIDRLPQKILGQAFDI